MTSGGFLPSYLTSRHALTRSSSRAEHLKPKPRSSSCVPEPMMPGPSDFLLSPRTPSITHVPREVWKAFQIFSSCPWCHRGLAQQQTSGW